MDVACLKGKVQTVLGLIEPEELEITLPHEHLVGCPVSAQPKKGGYEEPGSGFEKRLALQPLSLENFWWVRYHPVSSVDNLDFLDEQVALKEAMLFRNEGGKSIVELSNVGLARDPMALARISRATGLNVIMGSGYYLESSYPNEEEMTAKSDEDVVEEIVQDITVGVEGTGIRAGIIGELGCSWPLTDNEKKVLRAGAYAQKRVGCAISLHSSRNKRGKMEIIEVLGEAGADLSSVVMGHIDRC